ncbi:2629_t:CDS:2 [Rhizophagus irregularis]|nr:2629_t:CDS:2 [Rhizophagus irregularis]
MTTNSEPFDNTINLLRKHYEELKEDNRRLKEEIEEIKEINNLINNNQKINPDLSNYVKLFQSHKELQEKLNDNIIRLQDEIDDYITTLRSSKTRIHFKKVNQLFSKYQCNLKMNSRTKEITLIKALLQRHVIEFILKNTIKYFENFINDNNNILSLEYEINSKVNELMNLTYKFSKSRFEINNVTLAVPIKVRQQIFAILSNHGFSDIIDDNNLRYEHNFINQFKNDLNQEINSYRELLDPKLKEKIEKNSSIIIRDIIRLFFFSFKTQEPIVKWKWFNNNDKFNPIQMTGSLDDDDDIENSFVEICIFPLIYKDSDCSSKLQVYTPAKVYIHKEIKEIEKEINKEEESKEIKEENFTKENETRDGEIIIIIGEKENKEIKTKEIEEENFIKENETQDGEINRENKEIEKEINKEEESKEIKEENFTKENETKDGEIITEKENKEIKTKEIEEENFIKENETKDGEINRENKEIEKGINKEEESKEIKEENFTKENETKNGEITTEKENKEIKPKEIEEENFIKENETKDGEINKEKENEKDQTKVINEEINKEEETKKKEIEIKSEENKKSEEKKPKKKSIMSKIFKSRNKKSKDSTK